MLIKNVFIQTKKKKKWKKKKSENHRAGERMWEKGEGGKEKGNKIFVESLFMNYTVSASFALILH